MRLNVQVSSAVSFVLNCSVAALGLASVGLIDTTAASCAQAKEDGAVAQLKNVEAKAGRSGSWHTGAQGAPSVKACRKIVEKNPNDAVAHNDLGWALRQNGDLKGAEEELLKAISLNDKLGQAHCNLSVCYFDQGKMQNALDQAQKAVAIDQSQPIYHVVLGNAMAACGNNNEAVAEYKVAIAQKPDYENAYYNLGRVLDGMGDKTEAGKVLAQALRLDPDDERVLKILDKIVK